MSANLGAHAPSCQSKMCCLYLGFAYHVYTNANQARAWDKPIFHYANWYARNRWDRCLVRMLVVFLSHSSCCNCYCCCCCRRYFPCDHANEVDSTDGTVWLRFCCCLLWGQMRKNCYLLHWDENSNWLFTIEVKCSLSTEQSSWRLFAHLWLLSHTHECICVRIHWWVWISKSVRKDEGVPSINRPSHLNPHYSQVRRRNWYRTREAFNHGHFYSLQKLNYYN